MRVEGLLLDVGFEGRDAVVWIRDHDQGRVKLRESYFPELYAEPKEATPEELKTLLEEHPDIKDITVTRRVSGIDRGGEKTVLKIRAKDTDSFRDVARLIEYFPLVARTYDSDLTHELKYLSMRGLVPLSGVVAEADEEGVITDISALPFDESIAPPPIRLLVFDADPDGGKITTMSHALQPEYTFEGTTREVLHDFLDYFADLDPDIVVAQSSHLASVLRAAARLGIRRFGSGDGEPVLWAGRNHLVPPIYKRLGLAGLVERAIFTRAPARMCAGWAAGKCIDMRQCYDARRREILVPRAADYQPVMTLQEANDLDKGALILAPTVGLHEDVAVLDFESMFPNIILRRNVSYETTGRSDAGEGFIVGFTGEALARRLHFKRLRRKLEKGGADWVWCEERQTSLKEMLVVIYGYSGCFANRFGSMDTYMEINRVARESLVESMNTTSARGYQTLYGNNDSLFLRRSGATRGDHEALAEEITRITGLPMAVDSIYRYLVLLPQKADEGFGAVNRYYGVTVDGEYISRGIELRRRDTPPYVTKLQQRIIERLLDQPTAAEVRTTGLRRAREELESSIRDLHEGRVPEEELRVSTVLRRAPAEYASRPGHVVAAEALTMNHAPPDVGTLVDYLYVDAGNTNPFRRVKPASYDGGSADLAKYEEMARAAAATVLTPFG
jgi:DNA polymerase elongation subunit (family B)